MMIFLGLGCLGFLGFTVFRVRGVQDFWGLRVFRI